LYPDNSKAQSGGTLEFLALDPNGNKLMASNTPATIPADVAKVDSKTESLNALAAAGGSATGTPRHPWPTVEYGDGVHQNEGDFRWLDREGELLITVPAHGPGARLSFELRCGKMEWYPNHVLRTSIAIGEKTADEIPFVRDFQTERVVLTLPAQAKPVRVYFVSDNHFVGGGGDTRRLTVQLRQVTVMADDGSPLPERSQPATPVADLSASTDTSGAEAEYRTIEVSRSFDLERARRVLDVFRERPETAEYHRNHLNRYLATMERVRHLPRSTRVLEVGATPFGMTVLMREFLFDFVQPTGFAESDSKRAQQVYSEKVVLGKPQEGHGFEFDLQCFNIEKHKWPFPDDSFDLAICCEVFEHLSLDPMFAMAEANRVMRLGGTLLISVPNVLCVSNLYKMVDGRSPNSFPVYRPRGECLRHNRELTPTELATMFKAAGFEVVNVETNTFNPPPFVPPPMLAKLYALTGGFQWRHEVLTVMGRKTGPVVCRYPLEAELYYEWDVKANRV
jgi:SAM-dependent methyltransferase